MSQTGIAATKGSKSVGRIAQVRLEQPLELDERLVVKDDPVELIKTQIFRFQTIANCIIRKAGIVLFSTKTLLLCGRD